jgi:hypothetical protein
LTMDGLGSPNPLRLDNQTLIVRHSEDLHEAMRRGACGNVRGSVRCVRSPR